MSRGSIGQSTSMHRLQRRKTLVTMIRLRVGEICSECQGLIAVGGKALMVTGPDPKHFKHVKCHVPRAARKYTERRPGPVTVRWVEPRPFTPPPS